MVAVENKNDIDFDFMEVWQAFVRRHNATYFDAFLYDREELADEDFRFLLQQVSVFFQLPMPIIKDKCETIAKVMTSENTSECELYYNWQLMKKAGVNNKDSFTLVIAHEMSHQWLHPYRFELFDNELWVQELAADMLVGGFSVLSGDVATGKYKFALSELPPSLTHPDGKLRAKIVDNGRAYVCHLLFARRYHEVKDVLDRLPAFVFSHYSELQESWNKVGLEDAYDLPFGDHDVDSLPNFISYGSILWENYKNKMKYNENNGQ